MLPEPTNVTERARYSSFYPRSVQRADAVRSLPRHLKETNSRAPQATPRTGLEVGFTPAPTLDGAVNKRLLSTGESRELVSENVGSGLNPGG
jgi:hypothetical protein